MVPAALAATADLLTIAWLEWISDGRGPDGAQMLLRVAGAIAVIGAVGLCFFGARASGRWGDSALVGACVGVAAFALAWVVPLVLLALYPPT